MFFKGVIMPIEVYDRAVQKPLSNKDLETVLEETRKITKTDWVVQEWQRKPTWRDNLLGIKPLPWYSLCLNFGGSYQLINFYVEGSGTSINTEVRANLVMAYLMGSSNPPVSDGS